MSHKIILFNHKGGVSKTTTAYNIGWMLSSLGSRVLLVDADPQCNLSALILGDKFDEYYGEDSALREQNLKDGVKVAFEGKPKPIEPVACNSPAGNHSLFLLAGHPNLSEYDPALSLAQNSNNAITTLQNLPGAFNQLIELTAQKHSIDIVLIDLNPGLSAINQNLFTCCDSFIVPTNPDPFSLMALKTLKEILPRWAQWSNDMRQLFADATYPLPHSKMRFAGTVIQRFNIRRGKAARPYRENIDEIKSYVESEFAPALAKAGMLYPATVYNDAAIESSYCLAEISDFQGLLPKALDSNVPVFAIQDSEIGETGPVLANLKRNRDTFHELFQDVAQKILTLVKHANAESITKV